MPKYRVKLEIDVRARNNTDAACEARRLIMGYGMTVSVTELDKNAVVVEV